MSIIDGSVKFVSTSVALLLKAPFSVDKGPLLQQDPMARDDSVPKAERKWDKNKLVIQLNQGDVKSCVDTLLEVVEKVKDSDIDVKKSEAFVVIRKFRVLQPIFFKVIMTAYCTEYKTKIEVPGDLDDLFVNSFRFNDFYRAVIQCKLAPIILNINDSEDQEAKLKLLLEQIPEGADLKDKEMKERIVESIRILMPLLSKELQLEIATCMADRDRVGSDGEIGFDAYFKGEDEFKWSKYLNKEEIHLGLIREAILRLQEGEVDQIDSFASGQPERSDHGVGNEGVYQITEAATSNSFSEFMRGASEVAAPPFWAIVDLISGIYDAIVLAGWNSLAAAGVVNPPRAPEAPHDQFFFERSEAVKALFEEKSLLEQVETIRDITYYWMGNDSERGSLINELKEKLPEELCNALPKDEKGYETFIKSFAEYTVQTHAIDYCLSDTLRDPFKALELIVNAKPHPDFEREIEGRDPKDWINAKFTEAKGKLTLKDFDYLLSAFIIQRANNNDDEILHYLLQSQGILSKYATLNGAHSDGELLCALFNTLVVAQKKRFIEESKKEARKVSLRGWLEYVQRDDRDLKGILKLAKEFSTTSTPSTSQPPPRIYSVAQKNAASKLLNSVHSIVFPGFYKR
ncbi:MAG: hypothetical protein K1060chlam2_00056 [Chlamydiae bacterium]|nr:hypothetical protein [Chlamydiota bacterium]